MRVQLKTELTCPSCGHTEADEGSDDFETCGSDTDCVFCGACGVHFHCETGVVTRWDEGRWVAVKPKRAKKRTISDTDSWGLF